MCKANTCSCSFAWCNKNTKNITALKNFLKNCSIVSTKVNFFFTHLLNGYAKEFVQFEGTLCTFYNRLLYGELFLTPCPIPKLEVVWNHLFYTFVASFHIYESFLSRAKCHVLLRILLTCFLCSCLKDNTFANGNGETIYFSHTLILRLGSVIF
jgi:hypothetical protein